MTRADAQLVQDVYATLLPVILDPVLDEAAAAIVRAGSRTMLVGETRDEYVARRMSDGRIERESAGDFRALAAGLDAAAGARVLVTLDQELGGIQRLQGLVPAMPTAAQAAALTEDELVAAVRLVGEAMRRLGVGLALAPIVDLTTGTNPWLVGRGLGDDPEVNGRIGRGYVLGLQGAGVAATAKHFPGSGPSPVDPATDESTITYSADELRKRHLLPFRAVVDAGVSAVMLGPCVVESVDATFPSSVSPATVRLLREDVGFRGVIITDDLDSRSNARGRSEGESAVLALKAGADLLLVGLIPSAHVVAEAIIAAVVSGELDRARVAEAAARVRSLADG